MKALALHLIGLSVALISSQAHAAAATYSCTLQGSNAKASLVYYTTQKRAVWMPEDSLKTTKANSDCKSVEGSIECFLFGFQDQADYLMLPLEMEQLPKSIFVFTYHDDDDVAGDTQKFDCVKFGN